MTVFLICVGTFCVVALGYIVLSLRWWRQGYQPPLPVTCFRTLVLAVALLGIICLLYGRFVEPFWLEVKHVSLKSERIRRGTSLRIVHFSDLHSGAWPQLEHRIPALIAAQNPDLIVFTGDAVVKPRGLPLAKQLFASLSTIAPVYAVPGNQDYRFKAAFAVNGLHTLESGIAELEVRNNRVSIVGTVYDHDDALPALVHSTSRDSFHILLYHSPDQIEKIAALGDVDLYCAGHTHGGQVVMPWYGAVITMTKMGKKYESGLYRVSNTYLYVNRGLGMDAPRIRFLARPEITVLDIQSTY